MPTVLTNGRVTNVAVQTDSMIHMKQDVRLVTATGNVKWWKASWSPVHLGAPDTVMKVVPLGVERGPLARMSLGKG